MKTLGIIGGMSPESTVLYYQHINRAVNAHYGGNSSAPMLIDSVNFETVAALQRSGDWAQAGVLLAQSARRLQQGGAEVLLLATNTMHKVADVIENSVDIPFLHIVDATAAAITARGFSRVGLLGTAFTMCDGFYHARMAQAGVELLVPDEAMQAAVHRIIFEELCRNRIEAPSRDVYRQALADLQAAGAQGVILGCTEIALLINETDSPLPLFDSTLIHAQAAVAAII